MYPSLKGSVKIGQLQDTFPRSRLRGIVRMASPTDSDFVSDNMINNISIRCNDVQWISII